MNKEKSYQNVHVYIKNYFTEDKIINDQILLNVARKMEKLKNAPYDVIKAKSDLTVLPWQYLE